MVTSSSLASVSWQTRTPRSPGKARARWSRPGIGFRRSWRSPSERVRGYFVAALFGHRPVGPLAPLYSELQRTALIATGLGFATLLVGITSTLAQKRGSLFRNAPLLVMNLSAVIAGTFTLIVGGVHWGGASGVGWAHMAMPPLATELAQTAQEKAIMLATTVLVAPDGNGDAKGPSLGSGAVIRSERAAAFVVTCSHVAMPYASVAAFRDPNDAHPVWVYFSDGRHAEGRVVWTAEPPLDVAVVRVDIADPPNPVPVARERRRGRARLRRVVRAQSVSFRVDRPSRQSAQAGSAQHPGGRVQSHLHELAGAAGRQRHRVIRQLGTTRRPQHVDADRGRRSQRDQLAIEHDGAHRQDDGRRRAR